MQTNGVSYFLRGINHSNLNFNTKNSHGKIKMSLYSSRHHINSMEASVTLILIKTEEKASLLTRQSRVSCVADQVRTDAQKEWKALAGKSRTTFVSTIITGTITTLAGLTAGVAALVLPPLILVAIPVSIYWHSDSNRSRT